MHDALTGLLDRKQFFAVLDAEVNRANDHGARLALLLIDIRRFRLINSLYGFDNGDLALQAASDVLRETARAQDRIARIGDDEFAMILTDIANEGHARLAALKVLRLLEVPLALGEEKVRLQACIGIALCPSHASESLSLAKVAQDALYLAREEGQDIRVARYEGREEISEHWDIEIGLEKAIERSQLMVFFQPKVSLETGQPTGGEALLRWNSPSRGLLAPGGFLRFARTTRQIAQITSWVLNSALRLRRDWPAKWGELSVSVNVPPRLLAGPGLVDLVHGALDLWGQRGLKLTLEILEEALVPNTKACFKTLRELQAIGVEIAIDDFGTGYSSLSYFRDLPADELKIDRSFVVELLTDEANRNIVHLIVDLAHRFGLSVVAEGVEDLATLGALKKLGCDQGQGYYIAKPMPAEDFVRWLMAYRQPAAPQAPGAEGGGS